MKSGCTCTRILTAIRTRPGMSPLINWKPSETQLIPPEYERKRDNIWDVTPQQTKAFMETADKPWIAYKVMAEHGLGAATRPEDSPAIHYADTIRGGRFFSDPALARVPVTDAPRIVSWLESLGGCCRLSRVREAFFSNVLGSLHDRPEASAGDDSGRLGKMVGAQRRRSRMLVRFG